MKVNSILDIFGALIMLAAISLVVLHPDIVRIGGTQFNRALSTAKN